MELQDLSDEKLNEFHEFRQRYINQLKFIFEPPQLELISGLIAAAYLHGIAEQFHSQMQEDIA